MKKDEIIAKLTELGIEHDPKANKDDLFALLPVEHQGGASNDGDSGNSDEENTKGSYADVVNASGHVVRTYSKDVHGADFKANAKSYATKIGGTVKIR